MNKNVLHMLLYLLVGLLFSSCASRKEIVQFKDDTTYLRQQVYALRQENEELKKILLTLNKAILSIKDINQQTKADLLSELENIKTQSNIIDSKLTDNADRVAGLFHKVEQPTPVKNYNTIEDFVEDTTQQVVASHPLPTGTAPDPKKLYDTAYMDLTRGNYQLAVQGFEEYRRRYPESEFADNAQYWLGEVYYAQQEYLRAAEEFKKVIQDYPKGDKVPAALLKIGYTYINLNSENSAKQYLKLVIQKFPHSEEARLARARLASLE